MVSSPKVTCLLDMIVYRVPVGYLMVGNLVYCELRGMLEPSFSKIRFGGGTERGVGHGHGQGAWPRPSNHRGVLFNALLSSSGGKWSTRGRPFLDVPEGSPTPCRVTQDLCTL
jgi:hypothetical protein